MKQDNCLLSELGPHVFCNLSYPPIVGALLPAEDVVTQGQCGGIELPLSLLGPFSRTHQPLHRLAIVEISEPPSGTNSKATLLRS